MKDSEREGILCLTAGRDLAAGQSGIRCEVALLIDTIGPMVALISFNHLLRNITDRAGLDEVNKEIRFGSEIGFA